VKDTDTPSWMDDKISLRIPLLVGATANHSDFSNLPLLASLAHGGSAVSMEIILHLWHLSMDSLKKFRLFLRASGHLELKNKSYLLTGTKALDN